MQNASYRVGIVRDNVMNPMRFLLSVSRRPMSEAGKKYCGRVRNISPLIIAAV